MKVLVLFSPGAGRGKGAGYAEALGVALRSRGHEVDLASAFDAADLETRLEGAAALVVVGGDGTVNRSLEACERTGTPIYHFPAGNENLFARACGHVRDIARTAAMLEAGRTKRIDLGVVANTADLGAARRFALMVSLGPDASVIARLGAVRTNRIGHLAYVVPLINEAWDAIRRPKPAALRVWVDGKKVADDAGWLVVANSRHYALRIDPGASCPDGVDAADGRLDVAFFPLRSRLGILPWLVRCRLGAAGAHPAFVGARGCEIVVDGPSPWQVDGEFGGMLKAGERLRFECRQDAIGAFCSYK